MSASSGVRVVAIGALCLAIPSLAAAAQATPTDAVRSFYAGYAKQRFSGLPTGASFRRVAPILSASLAALIRAAQKEQARCKKAHADEKPPWIEGDMFTSNFEGFTHFRPSDSTVLTPMRATVNVDFDYVDAGKPFAWRDQVILVREGGRWVIDDVRYRRGPGFGNGFGEGLKEALSSEGGC
ncbi:MAG: DUF3828 domain-containing protein [bacterium]